MEHTTPEEKIMNEYTAAVDADVLNFVNETVAGTGKLNYVTVAFLSLAAAERIKGLTGKNVFGNRLNPFPVFVFL